MNHSIITLTTDYGTADGYAAALKGVLLTRAPQATLVDLSHDVPPFDRTAALLLLRNALPYFQAGTVHIVVVDPGVGASGKGLIVKARGQFLVGPDNGILTAALPGAGTEVYSIQPAWYEGASPTFHGRDVYAPVGAELANGKAIESLGSPYAEAERLSLPLASKLGNVVKGEVIHIDRFGNLISNISKRALDDAAQVAVSIDRKPVRFGRTFSDANLGESIAYWGSAGLLEIAVREGSAEKTLGVGRGMPVEVVRYA